MAMPGAVYGASPITGTVILGSAAPTGGVIALSSSNTGAVTTPATATGTYVVSGKTHYGVSFVISSKAMTRAAALPGPLP